MGIFQTLRAQPWSNEQAKLDNLYAGQSSTAYAKKIALRVFLGVVAVLFTLMLIAYAGRMGYEDWRPVPQLQLLWINTVVLALSSLSLQWAQYSVRHKKIDAMRIGLLLGGALTIVFLFGQVLAWRQLSTMAYFDITIPAIGFFYMITGVHCLHMVGGLIAWSRTASKVWSKVDIAKVQNSIELCTTYWHFLLLVWLVLFGLLFAGDNLDLVLKLCGIR
jgi:cytochrome c oxidase subunit 3